MADVWKIVALLLAGGFGILGLLTDYRHHETRKITKWGYISIVGIILSTVGGVVAQSIENSTNRKNEQKREEETQFLMKRSIKTVAQSNEALEQIRRILTPIGGTEMRLMVYIGCDAPIYTKLCDAANLEGNRSKAETELDRLLGKSVSVRANIYRIGDDAGGDTELDTPSDAYLAMTPSILVDSNGEPENYLHVAVSAELKFENNRQQIVSILDLRKSEVRLYFGKLPPWGSIEGLYVRDKLGDCVAFEQLSQPPKRDAAEAWRGGDVELVFRPMKSADPYCLAD